MKKVFILFLLIVSIASVVSVTLYLKFSTDSKNIYSRLNQMSSASYDGYELNLQMEVYDISLNGTYLVRKEENSIVLEYEYQELSQFTIIDDLIKQPNDFISIKKGCATISNGSITSVNGDAVMLPLNVSVKPSFNFNKNVFKDVVETENEFTATVINPKQFISEDFNGENVNIRVSFADNKMEKMILSYKIDQTSYTLTYQF